MASKEDVLSSTPLHRYCADPNLVVFEGRYHLYCTDDGFPGWQGMSFSVYVSDDLVSWERYAILDLHDVPWWRGRGGAWAPTAIRRPDGSYVMYFVADSQIGSAVAPCPTGPFVPEPEPLIAEGVFGGHAIDPAVFTDDDGTAWLLWGNGQAWAAPLREDHLSFDVQHAITWTPRHFREAVWVHKRKGRYYASWSQNDTREETYCVWYAMAPSLSGPWSESRPLIMPDPQRGLYGTGHHSIMAIPGTDEWIIAYHRFAYHPHGRWSGGDGYHRETVFAPLRHRDDGTIEPVHPDVGSYWRPLA